MLTCLLLLVSALSCSGFTWEPCDADKVPFIPDHVDLVPDPPAAGGQVVFKIQGNAGNPLDCASGVLCGFVLTASLVCAHPTLIHVPVHLHLQCTTCLPA
jgi:hypothetical protein